MLADEFPLPGLHSGVTFYSLLMKPGYTISRQKSVNEVVTFFVFKIKMVTTTFSSYGILRGVE